MSEDWRWVAKAGTPTQVLLREFELDPAISPFEARDKIRLAYWIEASCLSSLKSLPLI